MHVGLTEVDGIRIEAQQHTGAGHVEIPNLVDLVGDRDRLAEECQQRIGAIGHCDDNGLVPGMLVEIAADELLVFRPPVERVGGRVNTEKPPARIKSVNAACCAWLMGGSPVVKNITAP